jgi:hypothetical protein
LYLNQNRIEQSSGINSLENGSQINARSQSTTDNKPTEDLKMIPEESTENESSLVATERSVPEDAKTVEPSAVGNEPEIINTEPTSAIDDSKTTSETADPIKESGDDLQIVPSEPLSTNDKDSEIKAEPNASSISVDSKTTSEAPPTAPSLSVADNLQTATEPKIIDDSKTVSELSDVNESGKKMEENPNDDNPKNNP